MKSAVPVDYRKQSRSIFIALMPVLFMSIYYYGLRALLLCGFGAAVSAIKCRGLSGRPPSAPTRAEVEAFLSENANKRVSE